MNQERHASLERHFRSVDKIILSRQDPVTGLLPASTAVNAHGDYTDAWVRDNVYSILSVWGLALSYRRHDPDHYRNYLLSQSVVKLMRGLLNAMMRQADLSRTWNMTTTYQARVRYCMMGRSKRRTGLKRAVSGQSTRHRVDLGHFQSFT